jgi:hypothetical protein
MNIKKSVFALMILLLMLTLVQATKLEVFTTKETFSPREKIGIKVSLLNDENIPINDKVSLVIEDSEKINKIEKNIQSNEFTDIDIGENIIGGYWSIKATYNDVESLGIFIIEEEEIAEFELNKDILTITNTGNTQYSKIIKIIIGEKEEIKTPELEIGEKIQYRLIAPDGDYNIEIKEGEVTKISKSEVQLTGTGQAIGALDEKATQRSGITGGISPSEEDDMALISYMKKSSLIYVFILVVFGVAILLAIQRRFSKKKE